MVFGSRTAPPPDSAALAAAFQYRERIAGQPSPFFASGKYQGEKAGYEFKTEGERGAGYYRSHAVDDQFLARLERAEARDVHMATGGAQNPYALLALQRTCAISTCRSCRTECVAPP